MAPTARRAETPVILASSSPQRKTLLTGLGVDFVVIPSQVNEEACTVRDPAQRAVTLATEKAQEVAERHRGRFIIGCDTLVMAPDGTVLEKPADAADARRMLRLQSGSVSVVHSGLALIDPTGAVHTGICSSDVHFMPLSEEYIAWWIGTGLWEGRSGAFQIDGLGQLMITSIRGDWTGIVGLPVHLLGVLAAEAGLHIRSTP